MFDIIGVTRLEDGRDPLPGFERAFTGEPWQNVPPGLSKSFTTSDFSFRFLHHPGQADNVARKDGKCLILMGDAYTRWDARSVQTKGKLSADMVLSGYLVDGIGYLRKIKGNYTLILLDELSKHHQIITCKFAITPLYYAVRNECLYFSTSVGELVKALPVKPGLDRAAVLETMAFNFPMHERTFFTGVQRARGACVISIDHAGISHADYWDHATLYDQEMLPGQEAFESGSELFFRSVNDLAAGYPRLCVSFTSGFDSRVLHSVLQKDRQDVLAYSFGIHGSVNVTIPQKICARLHYPFMPIYLDGEFEQNFDRYAWQTVILSDGLVVQRANYPYAFEKISQFAPVAMTGLFGSEFLRTFQNLGTVVSEWFARINYAGGSKSVVRDCLAQIRESSYLSKELVDAAQDEVQEDVQAWFARFGHLDPDRRLYMYLLTEVDRKYFAGETSTERVYARTLFPFLDDEFIEFVFRSPFAGVYSRTITPTVSNRFRSQSFYAYLIRKYRPELLNDTTDHGYPPKYLLRPASLLWVGSGNILSRLKRRVTNYQEFRPRDWMRTFYSHQHEKILHDTGIFSKKFADHLTGGEYLDHLVDFDKVAALELWLGYLEKRSS